MYIVQATELPCEARNGHVTLRPHQGRAMTAPGGCRWLMGWFRPAATRFGHNTSDTWVDCKLRSGVWQKLLFQKKSRWNCIVKLMSFPFFIFKIKNDFPALHCLTQTGRRRISKSVWPSGLAAPRGTDRASCHALQTGALLSRRAASPV